MKKQEIKNAFKPSLLCVGMFFLLLNCEKIDIGPEVDLEVRKSPFTQKFVKLTEIPDVKNYLDKKTNNTLFSRTATSNPAIFDVENILEAIDTLNNTNYSFKFRLPNQKVGQFYNLVLEKTPEGTFKTPFVLKYVCNEMALDDFIASNFKMSHFKGTVALHRYTDYFENGYFSKTSGDDCPPKLDDVGDPIQCNKTTLDGSATSGGNSGVDGDGNTGNTEPGGGLTSTGCMDFLIEYACSCANHWVGVFCICGTKISGTPAYYGVKTVCTTTYSKSSSTNNDNCQECLIDSEGVVGINTPSIADMRMAILRALGKGTSLEISNWVSHQDNVAEISGVYYFLENSIEFTNNYTSNAIEFVRAAIQFLLTNQQYSFMEYKNWFSTGYQELETNPTVVNPDDITFDTPLTQQTLPTFSTFLTNFPKRGTSGNYRPMSTTDAYTLAGGSLLNSHINQNAQYNNACAIRASRGLLYSGIQIPVLKYNGSQRTQKGGDGKNYILDAVSFNTYMIAKFGETSGKLEGADANDPVKVAALLNGKNGIYVIVNSNTTTAGYSGHCDVIINGLCISGAFTANIPGGIKSIRIWELN